MINIRTAKMLAHYKQWADQRLFESLASLPPEEVSKERVCVLKSMIGTLNHVYVVDRIWQAHLQHTEHGFLTRMEVPYPALSELRLAQQEINEWFVSWSGRQTDESLNELIEFNFVSGDRSAMTAGAMLLHVVNHAAYHRGWVVQMYFEIPAKPPVADLPVFLTEVYPQYASA
jgi:uncharacterized damage-inducible protein DinB